MSRCRMSAIDVPAGKMVGLVGANGAGKSTLVNALAGWSRGRAVVTGKVILEGREHRQRLPRMSACGAG